MTTITAEITNKRKTFRIPALPNVLIRPYHVFAEMHPGLQRGWWAMALLSLVMITAKTYAHTWTEAHVSYGIQLYAYEQAPEKERAFMTPPDFVMAPRITLAMRTVGRLGNTVLAWLAWVGALTLALSFLGRKSPGFGSLLRIVIWAWSPLLIRGLIQTIYMLVTKNAIYNPGLSGLIWDKTPEPPPMLMGLLWRPVHYPTQQEMALAGFLGRIDLYTGWHLLVMARGLSGYTQTPRRKALLAVVVAGIALAALATVPTLFGQALGRFRFF